MSSTCQFLTAEGLLPQVVATFSSLGGDMAKLPTPLVVSRTAHVGHMSKCVCTVMCGYKKANVIKLADEFVVLLLIIVQANGNLM